jgi:ATP-dependent DNA helicase RecG
VVRHNDREEVYIRVGSSSRRATREQQARLYALGGMLHAESMPVPGTTFFSLDKARLENYLQDILREPALPRGEDDWIHRLSGLGLMAQSNGRQTPCTIAGLILFGKAPRAALRQAGLRLLAFDGKDKEYRALLDRIVDGPLVGRWEFGTGSGGSLIDEGLIEKTATLLEPFVSREADTVDPTMRRSKTWFYPWEAIRETVVNALAHRDWTRFVDIEIAAYADRLEVTSPGALQNSMTVEKMIAGQRSPRNPLIVEVLRDYGYVDARGMGIRTKIIPLMKTANGTEPRFTATEDYLKTVLPRGKGIRGKATTPKTTPKNPGERIRGVLQANPRATREEVADELGISINTVKEYLLKLRKAGNVVRRGNSRSGYWEVVGE